MSIVALDQPRAGVRLAASGHSLATLAGLPECHEREVRFTPDAHFAADGETMMSDGTHDRPWANIKLKSGTVHDNVEDYSACQLMLFERALRAEGQAVVRIDVDGALIHSFDDLLATLREVGGRLVRESLPSPLGGGLSRTCMFAWSHSICSLSDSDGLASASCVSADRGFLDALTARLLEHLEVPTERYVESRAASIYIVSRAVTGPRLAPLGG